jgi:peptidoglycan/xylan/chitin deacetylase (PgdA/CDA1 family)
MGMRRIPILGYHSVSDDVGGELGPYSVSPRLFDEHMAYLRETGHVAYTVSGLMAALDGEDVLPTQPVVITFDDGFADFETQALPVLLKYEVAATLYIVTGYVGGESAWLHKAPQDRRRMLTAQQLQRLAEAGIECGAHSHTHPELDRLPRPLLEREVRLPKEVLEQLLQRPVRSFAYPFGYYNGRVRTAVQCAGYESACATGDLMASPDDDPLAFPRLVLRSGTNTRELAEVLGRPVSPIARRRTRAKETAWRMMRRLRQGDGGRRAAQAALDHHRMRD